MSAPNSRGNTKRRGDVVIETARVSVRVEEIERPWCPFHFGERGRRATHVIVTEIWAEELQASVARHELCEQHAEELYAATKTRLRI